MIDKIEQPLKCEYCSSPTQLGQRFCCHACDVLFQMDYTSWSPHLNSDQIKKNQFMDSENFLSSLLDADYLTFFIEGLQCASCIHLLEKLPEFSNQLISVEVNYTLSLLKVKIATGFKMSEFLALIQDLGYTAIPLSKNENWQTKYQLENRKSIKRIALAGASAGNIMLFAVPIYGGLSGSYAWIFSWIMFVLFLPIITYCAVPFYQGAWNSLRYKVINIDLPIVVALLGGFLVSTINLINHRPEIYYDSTASFIFLILGTRYLVKRIQQRSLSATSLQQFLPLQSIDVKTENGLVTKLSNDLKLGDIICLRANQIVPADGTLYSVSAELDMSLLSGESLPQTLAQGMTVFAGTKALNGQFLMTVTRLEKETEIGKIITRLEMETLSKTHFITLSETLSQWLIAFVFGLAVIFFFIFGILFDYTTALNRSLALIVIACPCALAFGTPLTYALSLRRARDLGILIKNGDVFERLLKVKTIFFDKTGTLTSGRLSLVQQFPNEISDETKALILGLESESHHPIAFGFREAWKNIAPIHVDSKVEKLGSGVSGLYHQEQYSLESNNTREESGLMSVKLKKSDSTLAYFYFSDELHPNTCEVVKKIKQRGLNVGILSGDKKFIVEKIAEQTNIPDDFVFWEQSPTNKVKIIEQIPNSCMIGDGANDALALRKALVGISVKGSVSLSHSSSDVYFTKSGLNSILDLMTLAKHSHYVLKSNLIFALLYNFIGGTCALFGLINPLVAAVLMPISSLLIVANTYRGLK